jgi:hypothetical protein
MTDSTNIKAAGINSQKLKLFIRGKDMSATEHIRGISQLPKPPIKKGMTKKKTITTPCPVVIKLKLWLVIKLVPGLINSQRMTPLMEALTTLKKPPKKMYRVLMSL